VSFLGHSEVKVIANQCEISNPVPAVMGFRPVVFLANFVPKFPTEAKPLPDKFEM